nr:PREDICTED: uncharacterized protein LOC109637607 [Paralichthys olivaceus]
MTVCNCRMWPVTVFILWTWMLDAGCETQNQAEEVEIFNSDKEATLSWKSEPPSQWSVIHLGTQSRVPVLQACGRRITRTILSHWMERQEAHYLMMDIKLAQEEEPPGQLGPLRVHLFDTDTPIKKFWDSSIVLEIQAPKLFPTIQSISSYLDHSMTLDLGSVSHRGFQLAFSYSGTCVLLTSIKLYYKRCSDTVGNLALFGRTGAGSGPLTGSCVKGAVEVSPPVRECNLNGVWGPLQGGCTCEPGYQVMDDTCQACRIGYYKPTNDSAECQLCPAHSRTHREGSERCDCLQGFSRLPTDPLDFNCTKPPSAPVHLKAHHQNDSVLTVTWDPPLDRGGRQKVTYDVRCEKEAEAGGRWESCGDHVIFLPDSSGLNGTSVSITGLDPQCDYRLTVQALNDISIQQGTRHASTATVTIHRWKVPSVVITVSPGVNITELEMTVDPLGQRHFPKWPIVGALLGSLLFMAVIPIAVCTLYRNYTKLREEQEIELLPVNPGISYQPPQVVEPTTQQANREEGVVQMLEGFSGSLLASLKEVLVERNKLTLGKELGKGVTLQREQDSPLPVPLVILPYLKHGDLRRFLIATRYGDISIFVPHQSLLRFMIDIAAGMSYLSSQGFLHRDLAARNCMLGDDLRVCVADFGMSKQIYSGNYYRQKEAMRVPVKWMSMESLSESLYTTKSDVWSFGVTMWEIVSRGRTPYPGVHNHELLDLLLCGHRLKPPEECDQKLYDVMWSCWDKEPNQRPDFRELGETLKGLLSELPVLEASQEASYINQGLEAAAAAAAFSLEHQRESGERWNNVYLPTPMGACAARDEDVDVESGYLKDTSVSTGIRSDKEQF